MEESKFKLTRKKVISLIIFFLILLSLPLSMFLVQKTQVFKSKAVSVNTDNSFNFLGNNIGLVKLFNQNQSGQTALAPTSTPSPRPEALNGFEMVTSNLNVKVGEEVKLQVMARSDATAAGYLIAGIKFPTNLLNVLKVEHKLDIIPSASWETDYIDNNNGFLMIGGNISFPGFKTNTGDQSKSMAELTLLTKNIGTAKLDFDAGAGSAVYTLSNWSNITNYRKGLTLNIVSTASATLTPTNTPTPTLTPTLTPTATIAPTFITLSLFSMLSYPASEIEMPVFVDLKNNQVVALDLTLNYNSQVAQAIEIRQGPLISNWGVAANLNTPGVIKIAAMGDPIKGYGNMFLIKFKVIGKVGEATPVSIVKAAFNGDQIPTHYQDGNITILPSLSPTQTASPTATFTITPVPIPEYTVSYKLAENVLDLDKAEESSYSAEPVKINYTFKNTNPGEKYLWVRFKTNKGNVKDYSLKVTIAATPTVVITPSVNGIDLDVTFIERTPRYPRYCIDYRDNVPNLCAGTENLKNNLAPGDEVTYIAHVRNRGTNASGALQYRWYIDGYEVNTGSIDNILPGQESTSSYKWRFQSNVHTVKFTLINQDKYPQNNQVEDRTDALSYRFHVEKAVYDDFNRLKNLIGTYSFEDWIQQQIKEINKRIYLAKGKTVLRVDNIVIEDKIACDPGCSEHAPLDQDWDGRWGFVRREWSADNIAREVITYQEGLIHELSHQIGLIDVYNLNYDWNYIRNNLVVPECKSCNMDDPKQQSCKRCMYYNQDLGGVMNFSRFDKGYSEYEILSLDSTLNKRRGFYGEYLYDIPAQNTLMFKDKNGQALNDAQINIYQSRSNTIPASPITTGITGLDGSFALPNRTAPNFTTLTGHTLHPNPFGLISVTGSNGIFLIKIVLDNQIDYQWIDISKFNLAYWKNQISSANYIINTNILGKTPTPTPTPDFKPPFTSSGSMIVITIPPTFTPIPTQTPEYTVSYKVAESVNDLNTAPKQKYISEPMKINYTFKNTNPGEKYLWVRFKTNIGRTQDVSVKVNVLIPTPTSTPTPTATPTLVPTSTPTPTITPTPTSIPTPTQTPEYTVSYKVAESVNDLNTVPEQKYNFEPMKINYTFKNISPGEHFLWIRFITNKGNTKDISVRVILAAPTPTRGQTPFDPAQGTPGSAPTTTPTPTIRPTSTPTPTPVRSLGPNLLNYDMQNKSIQSLPVQSVQWFTPAAATTTYTFSGNAEVIPINAEAGYPVVAEIQVDEYDLADHYKTTYKAIFVNNIKGGSFSGSTNFTINPGSKFAVILRTINTKTNFKNISLTSNQAPGNLLNQEIQNAYLESLPVQAVQWIDVPQTTTYTLSGTSNFIPINQAAGYPLVGEIQVDEYDQNNNFVKAHTAVSTRNRIEGGTLQGSITFTIPTRHRMAVILRSINSKANFSNVSLKVSQ